MNLRQYEPQMYALLRIVTGFLFLWHGTQKLFDFPPAGREIAWHIVAIGGTVEFVGGLLIMLGFATRWAAFVAAGQMAYAYWFVHAKNGLLPLVNRGELAMLYCFVFLYFFIAGSGIWSVDSLLSRYRKLAVSH